MGHSFLQERGSGILLHLTSLPGPYGIGDLGPPAHAFVDFLSAAAQRYWQFLPTCPVSAGLDHSPYMGLSAFAGNPLLISPEILAKDGLLPRSYLEDVPYFSEYLVEFDKVIPYKNKLLSAAFEVFRHEGGASGFEEFCAVSPWLDDFSLFLALREENNQRPWYEWPEGIARRGKKALEAGRNRLADRILYHKFVQFCFFSQWRRLHAHAGQKRVRLIGDIPIYVALDSADVWAFQDCFKLHGKTLLPTHVAGVPPDYFSDTGQRWGNPLFRWHVKDAKTKDRLYGWWRQRFHHIFQTVDLVRIDHFRGFESFWEIPATEPNAVKGKWTKGPGKNFFDAMTKTMGDMPIIAEDLGVITPEVEKLRDRFGFPGMKILQFAFDSDEHNAYLPHNYRDANCVVYTGTHDNDTTVGWFFSETVAQTSKDKALRYAHSQVGSPVHWDFIRMAFSSVAALAIVPMQDVLGFGTDCRMNMPSTADGNWRWRCAARFFTDDIAAHLRDETFFYGRGSTASA